MTDGIIFDVDGTIWDSTIVVEDAWNAALKKGGYSQQVTASRLKGLFGLPMIDILRDILPYETEANLEAFAPICFQYEDEYLKKEAGRVYEGFEDMLKLLHGKYPLYIVSNCQAGYIELMLEKTGFGKYFDDHLCPGDTGLLKADNILQICSRHNLKHAIYVGDTQMDADACSAAKIPIVFAAYGFGQIEKPDYVINTPMELTTLNL